MTSQKAPVASVVRMARRTATDRYDCERSDLDPAMRARFWRCYFCGMALLLVAIFLFI